MCTYIAENMVFCMFFFFSCNERTHTQIITSAQICVCYCVPTLDKLTSANVYGQQHNAEKLFITNFRYVVVRDGNMRMVSGSQYLD